MRAFSEHIVVSLDDLRQNTAAHVSTKAVALKCKEHTDKKVKLYCYDCEQLICRDCIIIDHNGHRYEFINKAAEKCRVSLDESVAPVRNIQTGLVQALKEVETAEAQITENGTALHKAIDQSVDGLVSIMEKRRKELHSEATEMTGQKQTELTAHKKGTQLAMAEVESLVEFIDQNCQTASDQELLAVRKQMTKQAIEVLQRHQRPKKVLPHAPLLIVELSCKKEITELVREKLQICMPSLVIKVDPLIAESLKKSPKELEGCVQNFHVQITIESNTGTIWVVPTKCTMANWQEECEKCLTAYIRSKYMRKERKVPKEAGSDIRNSLPKETPVAISFNRDGTLLTTAGECDAMDAFHRQVEEICSAYDQMEESQTLTPEQYCYFTEMKQAEVTARHPGVKIKMNPDKCTITIQGSVPNVKRLKHLSKYLAHTSLLVQLKDPLIVQYLSTKDGKQHLSNFLQMRKCQVAVHFMQVSLTQLSLLFLCDESQTDSARSCANSLLQQTSVNTFPLPASFVSMLPEIDDYDDLRQNLEKQFCVQVVTMGQQVSVAGFEPGVAKCSQSLNEFIQEKCMTTKTIVIDEGKWRLFCGAMNITWRSVLDQIRRDNVMVTAPTDENTAKPQIVLKGDRTQVEKASHSITKLVKSVATSSIPLSRPGTCKFFHESEVLIRGIEASEKVVIEIKEIDSTVPDFSVVTDTASPSQPTKVCVARTNEAKEILLYVGDITEFTRAEVLVNAANGQLDHFGGVAKAIADKGGPVIQRESRQYITKVGTLYDGDIWLTTKVGNLPYKALIHAVSPRWRGGRNKEQALLHKACYGSLHKAQKSHSIAIPAIGAGIFRFPVDRCADALIGAAVEFSKSNPGAPMQEINFILHDQKDVGAFVASLKRHITPQNVLVSPTKQLVSLPVTKPTVISTPRQKDKKGETVDEAESMYKELEVRIYGEKETHVQKAEKILQRIIKDQFVNENVDDLNIANLTPEQTRELEKKSRELQVEIEINAHPLNYIRLRGDKGDVATMKYEILWTLSRLAKRL